jgi:hypothetical protein
MKQAGLTPRDLIPFVGSRAKVSELLSSRARPRGVEIALARAPEFDLLILTKWLCPTMPCWHAPAALQD